MLTRDSPPYWGVLNMRKTDMMNTVISPQRYSAMNALAVENGPVNFAKSRYSPSRRRSANGPAPNGIFAGTSRNLKWPFHEGRD